ncbi:MAG TPA: hypothetical protein VMK42_07490 [Anaeromyxobacteraceae bacterium]|nr:hypothetical protein [Anaeromyxobacteraceae bacterium]
MTSTRTIFFPWLALALASAAAAETTPAPEKASPEFEAVKGLAGEWQGIARAVHGAGEAKGLKTFASVRVVSAGSAVMLVTDPGTNHEMVTMFHRDDGGLVATHYCSAMNQPRMREVQPGEKGKLTFEFADGTNLGTHPGHMQRLVVTLVDSTHHTQEWTFLDGGKAQTMVFDMTRAK